MRYISKLIYSIILTTSVVLSHAMEPVDSPNPDGTPPPSQQGPSPAAPILSNNVLTFEFGLRAVLGNEPYRIVHQGDFNPLHVPNPLHGNNRKFRSIVTFPGGSMDFDDVFIYSNEVGGQKFIIVGGPYQNPLVIPTPNCFPFDSMLSAQYFGRFTKMNSVLKELIVSQEMEYNNNSFFHAFRVDSTTAPTLARMINEFFWDQRFAKHVLIKIQLYCLQNNICWTNLSSMVSFEDTILQFLPIEGPKEEDKLSSSDAILPAKVNMVMGGLGFVEMRLRFPVIADVLDNKAQGSFLTQINPILSASSFTVYASPNFPCYQLHSFVYKGAECPFWVMLRPGNTPQKRPLIYYVQGGPKSLKGNPVYNPILRGCVQDANFFLVFANYPGSTFSQKSVEIADGHCLEFTRDYYSKLHEEILKLYGYMIDIDRVAMIGDSYGGLLAVSHALGSETLLASHLKACVAVCPYVGQSINSLDSYIFGQDLSGHPQFNVSKTDKPLLILHGKEDAVCPYEDTAKFAESFPEHLRKFVTLIFFTKGGHQLKVNDSILFYKFLSYYLHFSINEEYTMEKIAEILRDDATIEGGGEPEWLAKINQDIPKDL